MEINKITKLILLQESCNFTESFMECINALGYNI